MASPTPSCSARSSSLHAPARRCRFPKSDRLPGSFLPPLPPTRLGAATQLTDDLMHRRRPPLPPLPHARRPTLFTSPSPPTPSSTQAQQHMRRPDPRSNTPACASPEEHTQSEVGCPRAHAMDLRHGTLTRLVCPAASPDGCLPAPCRRHPVLGTPRLPRPDVPSPSPLRRPRRPSPRWRGC
ncbi:hypothetical protein VPH35_137538 [Triticum aestivum]